MLVGKEPRAAGPKSVESGSPVAGAYHGHSMLSTPAPHAPDEGTPAVTPSLNNSYLPRPGRAVPHDLKKFRRPVQFSPAYICGRFPLRAPVAQLDRAADF